MRHKGKTTEWYPGEIFTAWENRELGKIPPLQYTFPLLPALSVVIRCNAWICNIHLVTMRLQTKAKCWGWQSGKIEMILGDLGDFVDLRQRARNALPSFIEIIKYIYFHMVNNSAPQQETFLIDSASVIFFRHIIHILHFELVLNTLQWKQYKGQG